MNPRITKRDLANIKGALRRCFARSELHAKVLNAANVEHSDPSRPKVKGWRRCAECGKPEAKSYCVVDHKNPVVSLDSSYDKMTVQMMADAIWSEESNLQVLDPKCHRFKTAAENSERRKNKKAGKK